MQVFLSWSGERSRLVSERTKLWLKCVIQSLKPWMSNDDISKGTVWFDEISSTLSSSSVGLVFLTKENLNSPWILFESGALANGLSARRICTVLIDLKPTDIKDPLAQFNHTDLTNKEEMKRLINTINNSLGENILPADVLDQAFITYWDDYCSDIKSIIDSTESNVKGSKLPVRSDTDILREILDSTRNMEKRINNLEVSKENTSRSHYDFDSKSIDINNDYEKLLMEKMLSKHPRARRMTVRDIIEMKEENKSNPKKSDVNE